jgi:hypothetical protein
MLSEEYFAWKFIIGRAPVQDPDNEAAEWEGCVAITIARTQEEAFKRLTEFAEYNGAMHSWLRVAKVMKVPLREGAVLTWFA